LKDVIASDIGLSMLLSSLSRRLIVFLQFHPRPAVPRSIPKDSAVYPVGSENRTGTYLTGVAPADGTGACPVKFLPRLSS